MANVKFPRGRRPPANGRGCHRATRLLDVGLDFCCERSVAGEAGGAVAASWDRTPRMADLGGVEVVRRWCRLPRRSFMARSNTRPNPRTRPAKQLKSNTKKSTPTASRSSGRTTKHERVLGLLQAKGGTTVAAISKVTGWQPHSVRGLAGVVKKKLGLTLASEKTRSGRIYRIVRAKTSAPSPSASGTAEQADS